MGLTGGIIMAYVITTNCIGCGTCAANCPVQAISYANSKYTIDKEVCVHCGACAMACPAQAIIEE